MSFSVTPTSPSQTRAGAFSLVIPPTTYCAGSDVEGEVVLDFQQLQYEPIDEIVMELRGTMVVSWAYSEDYTAVEKRDLVSFKQSLWKRRSAYPPPGSHVLGVPFRFRLPSEIPPSVAGSGVKISYFAQATGLPGPTSFFANSRKIRESLAVVPTGDPSLRASIKALGEPEGGPMWKTVHKETHMRRGLWGEYSTARVELLVPNEHGILPHCVDIPVLIKVKTTTARFARRKADKHPKGKPVFPAVDIESYPIDITLRRTFVIRVEGDAHESVKKILLTTVRKRNLSPTSYVKQWVDDTGPQDKEEMGKWLQQWMLQLNIGLNRFPPTFSCDLVDCAYMLQVEVPFPGIGNGVAVVIPITLDSGIDRAVPRGTGRTLPSGWQAGTTSNDTISSGGGAALPGDEETSSLPPTYFDAVYGDAGVRGERE